MRAGPPLAGGSQDDRYIERSFAGHGFVSLGEGQDRGATSQNTLIAPLVSVRVFMSSA